MNSRLQIRVSLLLSASVMLAITACHSSAPEPAPSPASVAVAREQGSASGSAPERAEFGPHRSPVVIRVTGPAAVQAGQDLEIVAEIDQFVGSQSAVSLELVLPPGARLVKGELSEQLPPGNGTVRRRFIVHLERVPETNVEFIAKAGNASFGARAQGAYRFGRPQPALVQPKRAPQEVVVGGRSLGHPIELKPTNAAP
ncbi:MAG: hypothetical protein WDO74_29015 [Pseudomonadota bacterium]